MTAASAPARSRASHGGGPDVTVIVAVYNAMPYLVACLDSLLAQTIGTDRMEIIAVDDGSTDGGGRLLDRYARKHPGVVKVVHQANSGGPAHPSNRALDRARGRYVFFVGADDYLGREALRRFVQAADSGDADVVLGRVVGVNGRRVDQSIFERSDPDLDLFDSALPWALANTKLFRRNLIETHGLRYREDMPMLSDQPFTLAALLAAERVSVLADYDYYFAVRRLAATNLTYRTPLASALTCVTTLMECVATALPEGPQREAFHLRHFSWEVANLLGDEFLRLPRRGQFAIHDGVRRLANRYLTDDIRSRLPVRARLPLSLAQRYDLDELLPHLAAIAATPDPQIVVDGDRWYADHPGFRSGERPDAWYDITAETADWLARMTATAVAWERSPHGLTLVVTATTSTPLAGRTLTGVGLALGPLIDRRPRHHNDNGVITVTARFAVNELIAASAALGSVWPVIAHVRVANRRQPTVPALAEPGSAPIRIAPVRGVRRRLRWSERGAFVIRPARNASGHLILAITPLSMRRIAHRLGRFLRRP